MPSLDEYINAAHHLVPAPQVLPQILPLLNQADADCRVQRAVGMEIVEVVKVIPPQAVCITGIPLYAIAPTHGLIQKAEGIARYRR